ncbi:MAG: pyridoxal phosphate-dependent aminotransferase family protein [Clostridia bacterium]
MDLFQKCFNYERVDNVKATGYYPYFHELQSRQDAVVVMEGKKRIMLGSNNYLGLTTNSEVIEAAIKATEKYGSGCSGSRFLNGTLDLHLILEDELKAFIGKEDCVTFSTGFQSNLAILSAICGKDDYIICDRENHASIYDGCKLSYAKMTRYRHSDMESLENTLKSIPDNCGKLIVTDGVFSMSGDICKLPEIVAIAKKYDARVMIDDAHGFGVLGNGGKGTADYFNLTDEVDIIMGTFSKSLASMGGFMVSNSKVCQFVRHTSRPFIFCASIPPSNCAAALTALRVLKKTPSLPTQLLELSDYMRKGLAVNNIKFYPSSTPIIPIYTYDTLETFRLTKLLFDNGVYVNPVIPPATPEKEALLRTSYMATHSIPILDAALEIIGKVFKEDNVYA